MRKIAATVLAVPILVVLYLPLLARRSAAARVGLLASVGIIVIVAAVGLARPIATTATQPAAPITALPASAFRSISSAVDLREPVTITFSEPMDTLSVATSISVSPAVPIVPTWNDARTVLTIRPIDHWPAGTYHTITIPPGTLAAAGRPMSSATRAAFITRAPTVGRILVNDPGAGASAGTIRISFDHPVSTAAVQAAFRISPSVAGRVVVDPVEPDAATSTAVDFAFAPDAPLNPGTTYNVGIAGLVDADGAPIDNVASTTLATAVGPTIVRFRPASGTHDIDRSAALSVRFSAPMSHATTSAAFTVTANGTTVRGTILFAESSTVLVFRPATALPYGAKVIVRVAAGATSIDGRALAAGASISLTTAAKPKPAPKPTPKPAPKPTSSGSGGSTGGAVGGGSWGAVEVYYLKLMNCTRTGGWVTSTGSCSSPGGTNVAPLKLDSGISTHVSRPYAKKIAITGDCSHFIGGTPADRLRAAGYTSYIWAENVGCRSTNPYSAVLGSHLFFQSEKPYLGGHYVNLMNSAYNRVGIGVWVYAGRVRLVVDFYHSL